MCNTLLLLYVKSLSWQITAIYQYQLLHVYSDHCQVQIIKIWTFYRLERFSETGVNTHGLPANQGVLWHFHLVLIM